MNSIKFVIFYLDGTQEIIFGNDLIIKDGFVQVEVGGDAGKKYITIPHSSVRKIEES